MSAYRNFTAKRPIAPEEIKQILEKYGIGKKPLAKLLGWGDITIIRYMDGDTPSQSYSDRLWELLKNPKSYYHILEHNQDNITKSAYKKSFNKILDQITSSKICLAAYYMKSKWDGLLPAKGYQCLLYFAQGFHLSFYHKPLFDEEFKLLPESVPYGEIYEYMSNDLLIPDWVFKEYLSRRERELLDGIVKAFRWYGYTTLYTIITDEKNSLRISRNGENERIISKDTIEKHFIWIMKEYMISRAEDISRYIDFKFAETREWQTVIRW